MPKFNISYLTKQSSCVILLSATWQCKVPEVMVTVDTQLLKGILEGCVLSIIEGGETYGYEILSRLEGSGFEELGEGTLYPIITRMDKNGWISCRKAKSPLGPVRKYYSITPQGIEHLEEFRKSYRRVTKAAFDILFREEE